MQHSPTSSRNRLPSFSLIPRLILSFGTVASIGLTAIGASGLLAEAFGALYGQDFVAGDRPGVTYTAQRCADFLRYFPNAASCEAAATAHHFGEVVEYRVVVGILGLLMFFGTVFARSRLPNDSLNPIFDALAAAAGVALFGFAAFVLLASGLLPMLYGLTSGAGNPLSGGIVSLIFFVGYGLWLFRTLPKLIEMANDSADRSGSTTPP